MFQIPYDTRKGNGLSTHKTAGFTNASRSAEPYKISAVRNRCQIENRTLNTNNQTPSLWTTFLQSSLARTIFVAAAALLVILGLSLFDFAPDFSYLDTTVLSGSPNGRYYRTTQQWLEHANARHGNLRNQSSKGSVDNLVQLVAHAKDCEVEFALIQQGLSVPKNASLTLLGVLPEPESLLIVARTPETLRSLKDLSGLNLGVGPEGSGTTAIARQILRIPDLRKLQPKIHHMPIAKQVEALVRGDIDVGFFVIQRDAKLMYRAIHEHKLHLVALPKIHALAARLPFASVGNIPAGHYHLTENKPPRAVPVLQINTMLVGNDCASRVEVIDLLTVVEEVLPGFVRYNQNHTHQTGLVLHTQAREFYAQNGADFLSRHLPWLVNLIPPGSWVYIVMAVSVLFNVMNTAHRFTLTQLDTKRSKIEDEIFALFGAHLTLVEITHLRATVQHQNPAFAQQLDKVIRNLKVLLQQTHHRARSLIVPMGQEMAYRYQQEIMNELLAALQNFQHRIDELPAQNAPTDTSPPNV